MGHEGDDGQFDDENEVSGTFQTKTVALENDHVFPLSNDVKISKAPDYAHEAEAFQDVCIRRAEVRDSLRSWVERSETLAWIFRTDFIAPIRPQEIANEEREISARVFHELSKRERSGKKDERLSAKAEMHPLFVHEARIHREEYAKYVGAKMKKLVDEKKYKEVKKFCYSSKFQNKLTDKDAAYELDLVLGFVNVDAVRTALKNGDPQEIVDALFELGTITHFRPTDFEDLPKEILQNPEFVEALRKKVAASMEIHPRFYVFVRDYFVRMGILDAKETDSSQEVQQATEKLLNTAMFLHPTAFAKLRDVVDELGIMAKEKANAIPLIQLKAQTQLAFHMKNSPEIYIHLRDKYAALGIIDADAMDADPEIQKLFYGHLLCWKKVHISVHGKFRFRWSKLGLSEPDWKKLGYNKKEARRAVRNAGSTFDEMNLRNCDDAVAGDRALEVVKNEAERVQTALSVMPHNERNLLEAISKQALKAYNKFVDEYEQFRYPDKVSEELKL